MAENGEDLRYARADDIALRAIAGENFLIVLHAGESKMFALNGMGLWFWEQLAQPVGRSELVARLLREYDVAEEAAAAEVDRFLSDLEAKRLARRVG